MKTQFWSPEALSILKRNSRQDLIDRGNALAERVTALLLTAKNRLQDYSDFGDLFNNKGGHSLVDVPEPVLEIEEFVNIRLRSEIDALEHLLSVFDDIDRGSGPIHSKM
jgi:hypothetical protein